MLKCLEKLPSLLIHRLFALFKTLGDLHILEYCTKEHMRIKHLAEEELGSFLEGGLQSALR